MFWLRLFLIPYIVTVIVEEVVALIWGYRSLRDLVTVFWINTLTNLSVTALRYLFNQWLPYPGVSAVVIIILELLVLLCEWQLFRKFLSKGKYFFLFSLVMNGCSYGAGFLIPVILKWIHTVHVPSA